MPNLTALSPITSTSPANLFWGINQSVRYGASTNILSNTAGIVDTGRYRTSRMNRKAVTEAKSGTTLVLLASDAITRYRQATGAVLDNTTGLLRITAAQFANLQSLFFTNSAVRLISRQKFYIVSQSANYRAHLN